MKSYTDIEQSKKLAEILPLESADYCWGIDYESRYLNFNKFPYTEPYNTFNNKEDFIPCWSLAALLGVLPEYHLSSPNPLGSMYCCRVKDIETYANNQIDACYEMVIKLHELKIL